MAACTFRGRWVDGFKSVTAQGIEVVEARFVHDHDDDSPREQTQERCSCASCLRTTQCD